MPDPVLPLNHHTSNNPPDSFQLPKISISKLFLRAGMFRREVRTTPTRHHTSQETFWSFLFPMEQRLPAHVHTVRDGRQAA